MTTLIPKFDFMNGGVTPAGAINRAINLKLAETISVTDFGADPTGATDSTTAFNNAIAAASGKVLVANGTFLINSIIPLASNIYYNFTKAILKPGSGCTAYFFKCTSISNFTIDGGDYSYYAGITPSLTIPTGTYANCSMIYMENCSNFIVKNTTSSRAYALVNIYNSTDFTVNNNYSINGNAGIAVSVNAASPGTQLTTRGAIIYNSIIQCGDDGIFVGVNQPSTGEVSKILVHGNFITKDVNAVNTLDGSVGAAVGIRVGQGQATPTASNFAIVVSDNFMQAMVDSGIYIASASRVNVVNNTIVGFAKRTGIAAPAIVVGDNVAGVCSSSLIQGNQCLSNYNPAPGIALTYGSNNVINANFINTPYAGVGALYLVNSNSNVITNNQLWNSTGFSIYFDQFSNTNTVENNNVTIYASGAVPVTDLNTLYTKNNYRNNIGYVTTNNGTATQSSGVSSFTVSHGITCVNGTTPNSSRIIVSLTPSSSLGSAATFWVSSITASTFTINTNANPGSSVTWSWVANLI